MESTDSLPDDSDNMRTGTEGFVRRMGVVCFEDLIAHTRFTPLNVPMTSEPLRTAL